MAETAGAARLECAAAAWVKKTLNEHRRVIFNGNGYSEAWEVEASAAACRTASAPPTR